VNSAELMEEIAERKPGETIDLTVRRDVRKKNPQVTIKGLESQTKA